jgi:hypothetical protein
MHTLKAGRCAPVASFAVVLISGAAFGQDCNAITNQGIFNIERVQTSQAADSLKYNNECYKDFSSSDDSTVAHAEVTIFGSGSGSGGLNITQRRQRLTDWCNTEKSQASSAQQLTTESRRIYQGALDAFNQCNALIQKGIKIEPKIVPDERTVDVTIYYPGGAGQGPELQKVGEWIYSIELRASKLQQGGET